MMSTLFISRFTRFLTLGLIVFVTCVCSPAQPQPDDENVIEVSGLRRTYVLYVPTSYQKAKSVPLVVALHGGYGNGQRMADLTSFNQVAEREGFIVVYPDGYQTSWADGRGTTAAEQAGINDVLFISRLVERLKTRYSIIPEQVYATGFSNGGYMSYRLACELPDTFAAVAPVGANMVEAVAATCTPQRATPVLQMNGDSDPLTPYGGGDAQGSMVLSAPNSVAFWANKNGCVGEPAVSNLPDTTQDGTTVTLTTYPGCQQNADIQLYTVVDGGHTWPGGLQYLPERRIGKTSQDIDASEVIWAFFAEHPMR